MSQVLSAIKQKYPAYANVPDDELALRLGQKYPVYLEQDSEFKSEFDQAIGTAKLPPSDERTDFVQPEAKPTTDLGTFIQQPNVTGPTETNPRNLQVTPQAPEGNLSEPFNTQFPDVEPAQIGATPAQLPRFGKEGTMLRGASDIVSGLGEFAMNKPEEFLASIYPPTQVAILMRYAPQMAKDFAVDAVKAAQGDGEAAGRATTMAALAALPFGIREVQKIRARQPTLPSPAVERAAIEALSTRDRAGEVVEPTAPKNLAESLLPRSKAALEEPAKPEVENAVPIRSAETVPLEVPPETGPEVGAQVREQAPAETQAPKEAVGQKPTPQEWEQLLKPDAQRDLKQEGVTPENIKALLDGAKTVQQVVDDQLGITKKMGSVDASTMIVEENADGSRSIGFNPKAGPASTPPVNVGQMSHVDAIAMAREQGVERIQRILDQSKESKPLPPATEEAPRSEAPTEATVSPATSEGVTAPPEPQAIPETTASAPTGQTAKAKSRGIERPFDIIDAISENIGKLRSKGEMRPGEEGYFGETYKSAKSKSSTRTLFGKGGQSPDSAVDALRRLGLLPENATVDDMWQAISDAADVRRRYVKGDTPEQIDQRFSKALAKQGSKKQSQVVSVGDLAIGDKFKTGD